MVENISSLRVLLKHLQQVPYLASKDLYRVTNYFLEMSDDSLALFCKAILDAKKNVVSCPSCFAWKEKEEECIFCSLSSRRDRSLICVVETWQEMRAIEKTGGYKGVYHVLKGAICPLDGVGPEDLTIDQLIIRAEKAKEIILATNQTPEGEATSAYIARKLKASQVKVSCLAQGVPIGSSLEYIDRLTVYKALSERKPF